VFYVDGVQVEAINAGETVSTYIDGDQLGLLVGQQPPAYLWTGTPHASTSQRSALTRAGGYLMNLQDAYNFLLTGVIGLGMAAPNNVATPYTVLDGARYLRTTKPPRTLSLPGRFQADDMFSLQQYQSDMRQAFDRDLVPIQQPMVLTVEPRDECGNVIGDFANVQCIYAGGLEGNDSNYPAEDAAPTFTMYVPFLIGGSAGAALTVQQSVSNANDILQRSATGNWTAMSTGGNGFVKAIVQGSDGTIYAGGGFLDMGGSGSDYLAKWDGSAWAVVKSATSLNAQVRTATVGPDGKIYIGGDFTNADGIAAADAIAVYDPVANTYAALGTGVTGGVNQVNSITFAPDGTLYAAGAFTQMGGVANTAYIAKWNGSAWSALSTGMNGETTGLATTPAGALYAVGNFTTSGGTTTNRVAYWNGSAWAAVGGSSGADALVSAVVIAANGVVYIGGNFTTVGGVSITRIAAWNGSAWSPLGTGMDATVYYLSVGYDGLIYASGLFTTAGGVTVPDHVAKWNGSAWLPLDVDFPGSATVYVIRPLLDGRIIAGFDTTGSAIAAGITTCTNVTPGIVYPRIVINGPSSGTSRIYQIVNASTGIGVWFNLTLSVGEVATLIFDPQNPSFTTTFQGDITSKILPGSQPSLFYLAPGANAISFFAASSTVTALISWQNHYNGVADLCN
jgi:hypothetical protein